MNLYLRLLLLLLFTLGNGSIFGQNERELNSVICEAEHTDAFTEIRNTDFRKQSRAVLSNITVTYVDFPEVAKQSFEAAVQIWETIIVSPQEIKIKAEWATLSGTTLAQSGATKIFRNFPSAPFRDVWYPAALAEAISGQNLNTTEDEITISLNKNINWSYDLTGNAVQGRFDMITVVLHEIAHGLGYNSSFGLTDDGTQGQWGQTLLPYIYDLFVQNSRIEVIKDTKIFGNPSVEVKQQITGNDLFFFLRESVYLGRLPQLSAVDPFRAGASISHLDEFTYPQGNENSLMTPSVRSAEVIHHPGDLTLLILNQIGWGIRNLPVSQNTITANEVIKPIDILVYPNPTSDQLHVFIPNTVGIAQVTFYVSDMLGRKVYENMVDSTNAINIDVSAWPTGSYFLTTKINQTQTTKKVVIIR